LPHLLDANVLITANNSYYPLDRVPEFWEWLLRMGETGQITMPIEMIEEIVDGNDDLAAWLSDRSHRDVLRLDEAADAALVQRVVNDGYARDLNDVEIEKIGRDPFLIGAALRSPADRVVVTVEVSKPAAQRANRKVPDVCRILGVTCIDTFRLIRDLNFSTRP
jgi:hypothetical protein